MGQGATGTNGNNLEKKNKKNYCEGSQALEEVAQSDCVVLPLESYSANSAEHSPGQHARAVPALGPSLSSSFHKPCFVSNN